MVHLLFPREKEITILPVATHSASNPFWPNQELLYWYVLYGQLPESTIQGRDYSISRYRSDDAKKSVFTFNGAIVSASDVTALKGTGFGLAVMANFNLFWVN